MCVSTGPSWLDREERQPSLSHSTGSFVRYHLGLSVKTETQATLSSCRFSSKPVLGKRLLNSCRDPGPNTPPKHKYVDQSPTVCKEQAFETLDMR